MEEYRKNDERIMQEIRTLEGRFDKHLEIYANNGRAMIQLAAEMKAMHTTLSEHMVEEKERAEKFKEVMTVYYNGKFMTQVIKWGFGALMAVGGAWLIIKQIMNR